MTDKIQQARRAAFEAKYPVPCWVAWNVDRADYYSQFRDSTRKRQAENYSAKWNGFNAALDCVVIELPPELHAYTGQPQGERLLDADRNHTIKLCRAAPAPGGE